MPDPDQNAWAFNTLHPQDEQGKRRGAILQAAYDVITEVGFEGLRTRAVADRTGINISTLHYYFPSKQDLVEGLAVFIGAKFVTLHGPAPEPSGLPALDGMRQEFSDARYYLVHHPDLLLAMQEFTVRGKRDAEVLKVVNQMGGHWRAGIEAMVRAGIADGTFRADLTFEEVSGFLLAVLAGTAIVGADRIEAIQKQTESWILSDKAKRQRTNKTGARKK